jgi:hypothetical protein
MSPVDDEGALLGINTPCRKARRAALEPAGEPPSTVAKKISAS